MKVAKKVRLVQKDNKGLFIKNDNYVVVRNRAIVLESVIKEAEANYKSIGLLWIVDEEATKERDALNDAPTKPKKEVSEKVLTLREEYKELSGKKANGNWKEPKLTEEINKLINS